MQDRPSKARAIIKGAKLKQPNEASYNWFDIYTAEHDLLKALGLPSEVARMTLFGLIAAGHVRARDDKSNMIDLDDCTIAELEGKPVFVAADQLRDWLRQHSPVPLSSDQRKAVILGMFQGGEVPPRTISWKEFYDNVRDQCGGWQGKRAKRRPARGFGDKQIQRIANELLQLGKR